MQSADWDTGAERKRHETPTQYVVLRAAAHLSTSAHQTDSRRSRTEAWAAYTSHDCETRPADRTSRPEAEPGPDHSSSSNTASSVWRTPVVTQDTPCTTALSMAVPTPGVAGAARTSQPPSASSSCPPA